MKKLLILLGCLAVTSAYAFTNTNLVAFSSLIVAPEQYKSKQVVYNEVYQNFLTSLPPYMQSSGFKEGKWFLLEIGSPRLPVLLKKTDANNSFMAMLKPGTRVKVTGRVKAFRTEAKRALTPDYYVDADAVTSETNPDPMGGVMTPPPPARKKRQAPNAQPRF